MTYKKTSGEGSKPKPAVPSVYDPDRRDAHMKGERATMATKRAVTKQTLANWDAGNHQQAKDSRKEAETRISEALGAADKLKKTYPSSKKK